MKVNLLCQQGVLLRDFEVLPYDDENDLVLSDADASLSDWRHVHTGIFYFPLHRPLELSFPYYIEFENGEKKEIIFTRVQATEENLRVGFKIKNTA